RARRLLVAGAARHDGEVAPQTQDYPGFRMLPHPGQLELQLARRPQIVGVKEREPVATRQAGAVVARRTGPTRRLPDAPDSTTQRRNHGRRAVRRTVVHDDDLENG